MSTVQSKTEKKQGHRIDVHHHFLPPDYLTALTDAGFDTGAFPEWTPLKSLAAMDANGISAAIVSLSSPGCLFQERLLCTGPGSAQQRGCGPFDL